MRLTRIVLTVLMVAACVPSFGSAQYAPKWQVGDWWVTKTWEESMSGKWVWHYTRYDIAGVEKVDHHNCYVLEVRFQGSKGTLSKVNDLFYVRTDDWLVIRRKVTRMYNDTLLSPVTKDYPLGLFGPFLAGEPRLPRFPLQLGNPDTTFKRQTRDDCAADLREISRSADSALVKRLLDEGDSTGGRVVRPTGEVFAVRSEIGGNLGPEPLPGPGESRITQSLQLWCADQPWRVFEELVQYNGPKRTRRVEERSWLIASGHAAR